MALRYKLPLCIFEMASSFDFINLLIKYGRKGQTGKEISEEGRNQTTQLHHHHPRQHQEARQTGWGQEDQPVRLWWNQRFRGLFLEHCGQGCSRLLRARQTKDDHRYGRYLRSEEKRPHNLRLRSLIRPHFPSIFDMLIPFWHLLPNLNLHQSHILISSFYQNANSWSNQIFLSHPNSANWAS